MSEQTQVETEDKRTQVARHTYLDGEGNVTKDIHAATGISYEDVESGETFTFQIPGGSAGNAITMLAVFGAKTKATNEASQIRQQLRAGETPAQSQVDAIKEAFGKIAEGIWREPGEGRVGAKVDRDSLAMAIVEFASTLPSAKPESKDVGAVRQRLDDDLKFFRTMRKDERVSAIYAKLTGLEQKKVDAGALL